MQITVPASDNQLSTPTPDVELSLATSATHSAVSFSDANLSAQTDNLLCAEPSLTPPEPVHDHGDLVASLNAHGKFGRECKIKPSKSRDSGNLCRRYRSYPLERRQASVKNDIRFPSMLREAQIQAHNYESLKSVQSILAAEIPVELYVPKEIDNNFPSSGSASPIVTAYVPGTRSRMPANNNGCLARPPIPGGVGKPCHDPSSSFLP